MREAEVKGSGEVRVGEVGKMSYRSETFPWIFFVRVAGSSVVIMNL